MTEWVNLMIRYRYGVVSLVLLVTLGLMSQIGHLEVILSSDNMAPQSNHYIKTGNEIESLGHKYSVAIAITATRGTIYQTAILEKVKRITARISNTPGVIRSTVTAIAAPKVKSIEGNADAMIVQPLMDKVPASDAGIEALKKAIAANPAYQDLLVSKDQKTTLIVADYKDIGQGMKPVVQRVDAANSRFQPMKLTAENVQTGHKTVIEFSQFKANVGVADEVFTARALEN